MKQKTCRSCGAPVIWAVTTGGKRMPVDAEPVEGGNVLLIEGDGVVQTAKAIDMWTFVREPGLQSLPRYVSHFATCPDAGGWRKR